MLSSSPNAPIANPQDAFPNDLVTRMAKMRTAALNGRDLHSLFFFAGKRATMPPDMLPVNAEPPFVNAK